VAERLLLDTNVLIEYLRGREDAIQYLEGLEDDLLVSAITVAELFVGARDDEEERSLDRFLSAFSILPVTEGVARLGGLFRRDYGRSHGTGLADALIAAAAEEANARFVTFNGRHFPMIEVQVPYERR
jgi:predicted nucleic acid-binding protein